MGKTLNQVYSASDLADYCQHVIQLVGQSDFFMAKVKTMVVQRSLNNQQQTLFVEDIQCV